MVRVFNDRGAIELTAMLNAHLPAGVVAARLDWAKLHPGGANVNALTSERLTDIGGGATFYSTLVEVRRSNGTLSRLGNSNEIVESHAQKDHH
jgi:anaerobic selenocysteine-containing dehydrogenase